MGTIQNAVLAVATSLALAACGAPFEREAAPSPSSPGASSVSPSVSVTPTATASPAARVTMTTRMRTGRDGPHRWSAAYPTLHGLPVAAGRRANAALAAAVDEFVDSDYDGAATTDVTPVLRAVDEIYATVHVFAHFYADGAAHGLTGVETYVFDRATGRRLTLPDFFPAGERDAALRAMAAYARQRLPQVLETFDGETFADGTAATLDNYADVTPLPEGLEVTFAEYQVAVYAAGMPVMTVPWAELPIAVPLPSGNRYPPYRDGAPAERDVLAAAAADPRVGQEPLARPMVAQWDSSWAVATLPDGDLVALHRVGDRWRVVDVGAAAGCTAFPPEVRRSLALQCA